MKKLGLGLICFLSIFLFANQNWAIDCLDMCCGLQEAQELCWHQEAFTKGCVQDKKNPKRKCCWLTEGMKKDCEEVLLHWPINASGTNADGTIFIR